MENIQPIYQPHQNRTPLAVFSHPRMFNPMPPTINPILIHRSTNQPLQNFSVKIKKRECEIDTRIPNPYILNNPLKRRKLDPSAFKKNSKKNPECASKKEIHHSFAVEKDNPDNPVFTFIVKEQSEIHYFEINRETLQNFPESSLATTYLSILNYQNETNFQLFDIKSQYLKTIFSYMLSGSLSDMEQYDINETFGLISACKKICCEQIVSDIDTSFRFKSGATKNWDLFSKDEDGIFLVNRNVYLRKGAPILEEGKIALSHENIFLVLNWVFYFATNENEYYLLNNIFTECLIYLEGQGINIRLNKMRDRESYSISFPSEQSSLERLNNYFEFGLHVDFTDHKANKFLEQVETTNITPFPFPTIIKNHRLLHVRGVREKIAKLFPHCVEIRTDLYIELIKCNPVKVSDCFSNQFKKVEKVSLKFPLLSQGKFKVKTGKENRYISFHKLLEQSHFVKWTQQINSLHLHLDMVYWTYNPKTFKNLWIFPGFLENFFTTHKTQKTLIECEGLNLAGGMLTDQFLDKYLKKSYHSLHMDLLTDINKVTHLSDGYLSEIIEKNPQLETLAFAFRTYEPNKLLYSIRKLEHLRKIGIQLEYHRQNDIPSIIGFFSDLPQLEEIEFFDPNGKVIYISKKSSYWRYEDM